MMSITSIELLSVSLNIHKWMVDTASTCQIALKLVVAEVLNMVSGKTNTDSSPIEEVWTLHVMVYIEEVDNEDKLLAKKMVRWANREKKREVLMKTLPLASVFEERDTLPTGVY